MRRARWLLLVSTPALLIALARLGLGDDDGASRRAAVAAEDAPTSVTLPLDDSHVRRAPRAAAVGGAPGAAGVTDEATATAPAPDPWDLPASDPRRGLVDAFRGMNDDTTPVQVERAYVEALERGGASTEEWTRAARTTADAWFAGLNARVTCYTGGCAAWVAAPDLGALTVARERVTQQAGQAGWMGPVITTPAITESDGTQRLMWIFVRPE